MTTYPRRGWLRFGFGFGVAAGFAVVEVLLVAGVVVLAGLAAPLAGVGDGLAAAPAGTPEADAVSVVGVAGPVADTGRVVKGVGSGGSGLAKMPAIN